MSLSYLRDNIVKALQEKADAASSRAMNNHPLSHQSTDTYAMQSVDALSEARAFLVAMNIVNKSYNDMIEPEKKQQQDEEDSQPKPEQEPIY